MSNTIGMGWEGGERAGKIPLKNSTREIYPGHLTNPHVPESREVLPEVQHIEDVEAEMYEKYCKNQAGLRSIENNRSVQLVG